MPTFDDLLREHADYVRSRSADNARWRMEQRGAERKLEEAQRLVEQRRVVESERWGSPEGLLATWEARAPTLVTAANQIASQLRLRASVAKSRFHYNTTTEERGFLGANRSVTQEVDVASISYTYSADRHERYDLDRYCQPHEFNITLNGREAWNLDQGLYDAICELLAPAVAAERIERGDAVVFGMARALLRYCEEIRAQTLPCKWNCVYESSNDTTEDDVTQVYSDAFSVLLHNPARPRRLQTDLEDLYLGGEPERDVNRGGKGGAP